MQMFLYGAGGGIRYELFTDVLSVLKSSVNCPPGAIVVRCDLPVLLHALLHVAISGVFRATSFRRIILAVHAPLSISEVQPQKCVPLDQHGSLATLTLQSSHRSFCVLSLASPLPLVCARGAAVVHLL